MSAGDAHLTSFREHPVEDGFPFRFPRWGGGRYVSSHIFFLFPMKKYIDLTSVHMSFYLVWGRGR